MNRVLCFALMMMLLSVSPKAFALDWRRLHGEADDSTLEEVSVAAENLPSADSYYRLGLAYLNRHEDAKAADAFAKVLDMDASAIEAKWGLAEVFRRQHALEKSKALLSDVLKNTPDFPPALITLAYLNYTDRDFNEAVNLAKKVLAQGEENVDKSNFVRAHLMVGGAKGLIAHFGGPLSKAINGMAVMPNLRAAERLKSDSPEVKFGLGSFYLLAPTVIGGDVDKAIEYLKQAIDRDPLFADVYVRLAQAYKIKGDGGSYERYLNKALEIDPLNQLANDIKSGECDFICM